MYGRVALPGALPDPQVKCTLDTWTKIVPYTIIFKLAPKFKLLHKSEITVAQGTLQYYAPQRPFRSRMDHDIYISAMV